MSISAVIVSESELHAALVMKSSKKSSDWCGANLRSEAALLLERASLGLSNHGVAGRASDDVVVLGRRLRLHVHIYVTHSFLVRRRWIRNTDLPGREVITGVGGVRLVSLPPLVHGHDCEAGVSLAHGGAALRPFA